MPKGYLFDTVACSRWRRGDAALRSKVEALPSDAALYTSVISVGELTLGIHKAPQEHKEKLRQRTQEMLARFESIFEVTREVADRYGNIVSQVPPGQHIGQNDYWIAAIALAHDLVLITNDPRLRPSTWLAERKLVRVNTMSFLEPYTQLVLRTHHAEDSTRC